MNYDDQLQKFVGEIPITNQSETGKYQIYFVHLEDYAGNYVNQRNNNTNGLHIDGMDLSGGDFTVGEKILEHVDTLDISTSSQTPQHVGSTITLTAMSTGSQIPFYQFWLNNGSGWKVVQDYSTNKEYNWKPSNPGDYQLSVYAKDKNSPNKVDQFKVIHYKIEGQSVAPVEIKSVSSQLPSPQKANSEIQIIAEAIGGEERLYQFWINDGTGWKMKQDYTTSNQYNWIPTSVGNYQISVYTKDRNSAKKVDDFKIIPYKIEEESIAPVVIKSVSTQLVSPQKVNSTIQINAEATGSNEILYQFWINNGSGWKIIQDYSSDSTINWVPSQSGDYQISVYVKDKNSRNRVDDFKLVKYKIND
jgi:hypothetical protein